MNLKITHSPVQSFLKLGGEDRSYVHDWKKIPLPEIAKFVSLSIAPDQEAKSMDEDPNWRNNWRWLLLVATGSHSHHPCTYCEGDKEANFLVEPINGNCLFAVRVGDKPFNLFTCHYSGSGVYTPDFCFFDGKEVPLIGDKALIISVAMGLGKPVTFI
ncbi:MAG: hypothetical protein RLZZ230_122 [Candidatus Parcubacteria bacterium]|jgi:hypothetical protein